ncbi:hypothetical protein [Roseovarius aestuariivivens]|uniref:hypothetical protein n=1 Tax=Roseovarius aestuariivivens TaxID=1888910 RepID=UPI001081FC97|nr:hypothetical protein [Roseovarius aestuariivivens]
MRRRTAYLAGAGLALMIATLTVAPGTPGQSGQPDAATRIGNTTACDSCAARKRDLSRLRQALTSDAEAGP